MLGTVRNSTFGGRTMIRLRGNEFPTVELVDDPHGDGSIDPGGDNPLVNLLLAQRMRPGTRLGPWVLTARHGDVSASWSLESGLPVVDVTVPDGVTATVRRPRGTTTVVVGGMHRSAR